MANYDLDYEGSVVQDILDTGKSLEDDGYIFLGTATPSTIPGTPTERVAYIGGPGTYNNFGTTVVVPSGSIVVITYSGSAWSKTVINPSADGYVYAGIATAETNPGTPTGKVFYIATTVGTYTHFGNISVSKGINILKYNGTAWSKDVAIQIIDAPTENSEALVTAGGVYNALAQILGKLAEGYIYAGIATAATNPGTPTGKVFYIATAAGTYTNFGGLVVTAGINVLKYDGANWSQEQLIGIDDVPAAGSDNLVKSGGVSLQCYSDAESLDLSQIETRNGFIYANTLGDVVIGGVHCQHYVIPSYKGNIYIKSSSESQCVFGFVKKLPVLGGAIDWCKGTSRAILTAGALAQVVIPYDCSYILIQKDGGSTTMVDYSPEEVITATINPEILKSILRDTNLVCKLHTCSLYTGDCLFELDFTNRTIKTNQSAIIITAIGHSNKIPNITYISGITEQTTSIEYTYANADTYPYWIVFDANLKKFRVIGHNNNDTQYITDENTYVIGVGTPKGGFIVFTESRYYIDGIEYPLKNRVNNLEKISAYSKNGISLSGKEIEGFIGATNLYTVQTCQSYLIENSSDYSGISIKKKPTAGFVAIVFLREAPVLEQNFVFCIGTSRNVFTDNLEHILTIPEDCNYIAFTKDVTVSNEVVDATPSVYLVGRNTAILDLLNKDTNFYNIPANEITARFENFENYNIVGANKILSVIKDSSGNYYTPPIEISGGKITNVTVLEDGGSVENVYTAYCVHSDSNNNIDNKIVVSDCIFDSNSNACWGVGTRKGYEMTFINCVFIQRGTVEGLGSGNLRCWYSHNKAMTGASYDKSQKSKVSFINCQFLSLDKAPMYLQDQSKNGNEGGEVDFCEWEFVNCTFGWNGDVEDSVKIDYIGNAIWETDVKEFKWHFMLSPRSQGNNVSWLNYEAQS